MDEEIPYNELLLDVEDGIVVGLYHYLWLKDGKGRACPEVNIPHTIIICNGRPKVWYFTSGKERCVKRKNRANITNATITEALAPVTNSSSSPKPNNGNAIRGGGGAMGASGDVAPSLLGTWGVSPFPGPAPQQQQPQPGQGYRGRNSNQQQQQQLDSTGGGPGSGGRVADGTSTGTALGPWPHHGVVARFQGSMTMPHNAGGTATRGASLGRRRKGTQFELQDEAVEFFTREQLAEMLPPGTAVVHGVAALHEGVLQRFVQPRGQHHFSIRATWSPNACVVERRTSKAKLNDPRVSLADRLAGWDGPNWLSDHTLITGTVLHGSICRLCDNVAAHLADVSGGGVRVLRMVLFFCVDEANRIWLTHCGSLKTQRLREYIAATGPHLMQHVPSRMRAGSGAVPPLLPSPSAALRLRSPDGAGALSADPSLDLPAPSAAFLASKAAMAAEASSGSAGGGGGGRFLCVLTGEMYPAAQRCDVTYKQLLQHWFSLASQLPNEGDRLRAMDTIPLAIRRANPSLTREWYLRVRSQPTFLYRTAPVCLEAAAQITGLGPDELQRTVVLPSASGSGAAAAAAAAGPGPGSGPQQVSNPGTGLLAGWGGAGALVTHGSPPGTARAGDGGGALSRQTTNNTTGAVRAQLTVGPTGRQRPATALPPAGPSSGGGGGHSLMLQQPQPVSFRSGSRMQQPQQAQLHPGATATARRFATRSKSASPSVATSRLPPTLSSGGGAGGGIGGGGLPSMLLPRDSGLAAGGSGVGGGLGRVPSFLQVYGPTPEQAAEAAAAAAALPYEVLDDAQQMGDAGGDDPDGSDGADEPGPRGRAQPEPDGQAGRAVSPRSGGHCRVDTEEGGGDGRNGDDGAAEVDGLGPSAAQPSSPSSAAHPAGTAGGGGHGRPGSPRHGAGGSGQASGYASASTAVPRTSSHSSRQFPPVGAGAGSRISTSSELTEMGSVASFSDPTSPNSAPAYYSQAHGAAAAGPSSVAAVGPSASAPSSAAASRLSPPRSAGLLTLHTIHEEGGSAAALPPPPSASSGRSGSPLAAAGTELLFPPPSRCGAGPHSHSHSVPRMRPPSRAGGLERQALQAPSRRLVGGGPVGGQMYTVVHHHHHGSGGSGGGARCGSFSESGDLAPSLPGAAAGAGAGMGGVGSLNSTLASSVGSQSRRSVSNQAGGLSSEDMRTLRELSEAYTAAERLTQQLLAQAHEILSEDGGSRPGSTGTSPMHGGRGRQPPVSPRGTGTIPNSRPGTGNSISAYAAFSGAGGGLGGVRRLSSSNGSGGASNGSGGGGGSGRPGQRPGSSALTPAPAPGPSPLGQQEPTLAPTAGSDRSSNAATANAGGAAGGGDGVVEGAAAGPGPDRALLPTQSPAGAPSNQPPMLVGTDSAASGALQEAAVGTGASRGMVTGTGSAAEAGGASGTGPAVGSHPHPHPHVPPDLGLFTSAEADLLAEALQD